MKRRFETKNVLEHVHHANHKKLDLRNSVHKEFSCQKFKFGLAHPKENITAHGLMHPRKLSKCLKKCKK